MTEQAGRTVGMSRSEQYVHHHPSPINNEQSAPHGHNLS